jgi:cholesterol transport system auxiliary component
MPIALLTRRAALMAMACTLGGCSAVSALNSASQALDTYDLLPVAGSQTGRRSGATLLVARPSASGAIATDRIMVKPDALSITYLPDARWSDELPLVVQSLLIRSISGTGRMAYVGRSEGGPVPDRALLVRLDAFQVARTADGRFEVAVDIALTLLNDRDQRVIATRSFAQSALAVDDAAVSIVATFQRVLDVLLPAMSDWVVQRS